MIYSDLIPRKIAWDGRARQELSDWVAKFQKPYSGDALPSVPKCRRCSYFPICDQAARVS